MLKTVSRALQLLYILGANPQGMSLSALARAGSTNKQDVFRLVKTLAAFQFVNSDPQAGKIRLGPGVLSLAEMARPQLDLRQISMPTLTTLRDKTGETACLHMMMGDQRVCVVQVESRDELRCVANIGDALPLTAGAPGRVFLAYLSDRERKRLLKSFARLTDETVVEKDRLSRMISDVRRYGYTVARNETVYGMAAVSAPVFDASGHTIAAVTVLGPSQRLTRRRLIGYSTNVRTAAQQLSVILGYDVDQDVNRRGVPTPIGTLSC